MSNPDKALGATGLVVTTLLFVLYTLWILATVSAHPWLFLIQ
jgi:hypothetical protein